MENEQDKKFTYSEYELTVNTDEGYIKYLDKKLLNTINLWDCTWFEIDLKKRQLLIKPRFYRTDVAGNVLASKIYPQIKGRLYTNEKKNSDGVGYFDYFFSITNANKSFGGICASAMINNQLENLEEVFGEDFICYNPLDDWEFFLPIQYVIEKVELEKVVLNTEFLLDSVENVTYYQKEKTVINVINPSEGNFLYKLFNSNGVIQDFSPNNEFTELDEGEYTMQIVNMDDQGVDESKFVIKHNIYDELIDNNIIPETTETDDNPQI